MTFSCKIKLITTISSKKIQEVIEAIEEAETLAYLLDERFTEDIRDILKRVEGLVLLNSVFMHTKPETKESDYQDLRLYSNNHLILVLAIMDYSRAVKKFFKQQES